MSRDRGCVRRGQNHGPRHHVFQFAARFTANGVVRARASWREKKRCFLGTLSLSGMMGQQWNVVADVQAVLSSGRPTKFDNRSTGKRDLRGIFHSAPFCTICDWCRRSIEVDIDGLVLPRRSKVFFLKHSRRFRLQDPKPRSQISSRRKRYVIRGFPRGLPRQKTLL